MSKQTILVFGATGAQGGSVAHHLLGRGFAVRAFTRKPDSPAAQALRAAGAELAQGDLDDVASIQAALGGAQGVFGVTNFWEHFDKEAEQGRKLVDAVAVSDVEQFVFSTLEPIAKNTGGKLKSPHFDIKAELEERAKGKGIPMTVIHVPFYYDNFLGFFPPRPVGDGTYVISFPQGDTPLAAMAAEDVGLVVAPMFESPAEWLGKVSEPAGDELPASEYAAIMGKHIGATVNFAHMPREAFAALGFPGAEDLADMFEYYRVHIASRRQAVADGRALGVQSFDAWMGKNAAKLRAALGLEAAAPVG